jgi:hypothetical protein
MGTGKRPYGQEDHHHAGRQQAESENQHPAGRSALAVISALETHPQMVHLSGQVFGLGSGRRQFLPAFRITLALRLFHGRPGRHESADAAQ